VNLSIGPKAPVVEKELAKAGSLNPLQKLFRNNLIRIDIGSIKRDHQAGVTYEWLHNSLVSGVKCRQGPPGTRHPTPGALLVFPLPHVDKMSGDCRGRSHCRTYEMRSTSSSLPAFKVPIAG
jgi:hypothetical protein